jgi:hypothetical protein
MTSIRIGAYFYGKRCEDNAITLLQETYIWIPR